MSKSPETIRPGQKVYWVEDCYSEPRNYSIEEYEVVKVEAATETRVPCVTIKRPGGNDALAFSVPARYVGSTEAEAVESMRAELNRRKNRCEQLLAYNLDSIDSIRFKFVGHDDSVEVLDTCPPRTPNNGEILYRLIPKLNEDRTQILGYAMHEYEIVDWKGGEWPSVHVTEDGSRETKDVFVSDRRPLHSTRSEAAEWYIKGIDKNVDSERHDIPLHEECIRVFEATFGSPKETTNAVA